MTEPQSLLVACLCAGWCTTCDAYRPVFEQAAREHPAARFVWVDVEDHSDALGDAALDIEDFPTLMILRGGQPRFYGTVLPHAGTLGRLVEAVQHGELPPLDGADAGLHELSAGVLALAPRLAAA